MSPAFGGNTVAVTKRLQTGYTRILCFSDIQFSYAGLDHWCRKNGIPPLSLRGRKSAPAIPNRWARAVMDPGPAKRNIRNYPGAGSSSAPRPEPVRRQLENESVSTVPRAGRAGLVLPEPGFLSIHGRRLQVGSRLPKRRPGPPLCRKTGGGETAPRPDRSLSRDPRPRPPLQALRRRRRPAEIRRPAGKSPAPG